MRGDPDALDGERAGAIKHAWCPGARPFCGRALCRLPAVRSKNIRVRDRATLFNLLIGLQGYTVCSGVIDSKLNGENIVAVPLTGVAPMEIGYILPAGVQPGSLCRAYIENLKQYVPID